MPKRRTHDSFDADDNPIGLTGAFAPIKGPQSVDYDTNDDPVGLTQAFGAIPDDEDERPWDEDGKWKDFDWDAAFGEPVGDYGTADEPPESGVAVEPIEPAEPVEPAEPAGEPVVEEGEGEAKADAEAAPEAEAAEEPAAAPAVAAAPVAVPAKPAGSGSSSGPRHGRHAAAAPELSPRMKKSRRVRRVLIVLVILLILVIAAVAFFGFRTVKGSQQEAAQQTQSQASADERTEIQSAAADAPETTTKLADVPDLTGLLGMTQDQAIAAIGRGALVTANREVSEEGNPIKTNLNVALTEEAADSKTGTPTVYLSLDKDGKVIQVGYSASASALGFGSLSFADAVNSEHVVEKTLARIGVNIPEGSAKLPENKSEYSTYASDGKTVVRERCSFEGDTSVNGKDCTWSAVLSYDYTTQVVTGNLNDTVRIIYVYITEDVEAEPEDSGEATAGDGEGGVYY